MSVKVLFKLEEGAKAPSYESPGAAGMDIRAFYSFTCEGAIGPAYCMLRAGKTLIIPTGIYVQIPQGYEIQVRSRSGLAAKNGIFVLNSPGTIDSDYRGEIKVILKNTSSEDFKISSGDRIAQLVVAPVVQAELVNVDTLDETERGVGGFGSTGVA